MQRETKLKQADQTLKRMVLKAELSPPAPAHPEPWLSWDAATSALAWKWTDADPPDSWGVQTSPNGIDQWGDYDGTAAGARSYSDTGLAGLYCRVFGKDANGNPCTPVSNAVQAV